MSFLNDLGKKFSEVTQEVSKKSGEVVNSTKINMSIKAEREKIERLQIDIGKRIYEKFDQKQEVDEGVKEFCEQIKIIEGTIDELNQKLQDIKNVRKCTSCGKEISKEIKFCPGCGGKQEDVVESVKEVEEKVKKCACGAELEEGAVFCVSCGAKVEG